MSSKLLYLIAFFAWAIALIQKTPLAFLSKGTTDTAFGFAVGISIAAVVTWLSRPHEVKARTRS